MCLFGCSALILGVGFFCEAVLTNGILTREGKVMAQRIDSRKLAIWTQRLSKFRESGMSVTRFCASEAITMSAFSYWSKRLAECATKQSVVTPANRPVERVAGRQNSQGLTAVGRSVTPSLFSVRLHDSILIEIPTDQLETIRCVMQCIQETQRPEPESRFHRVVVGG